MAEHPGPVVQTCRGLTLGAAVGTLLGASDFARGLVGLGDGFPAGMLPGALVWYASLGGVAGAAVACAATFSGPRDGRWTLPALVVGACAFVAGVLVNHTLLPHFAAPISLAVDVSIVAIAAAGLRWWGRRGLPDDRPAVQAGALLCLAPIGCGIATALGAGTGDAAPRVDESAPDHPNVLLVVVDTLRADHTSLHGYPRPTTPNLDRFGADALVFGQMRSTSPWTIPSVATLHTGLAPLVHTAHAKANCLPDDAVTLAEILSAVGYRTGMFSDNPLVCAGYGFDQGFEHVDDRMPEFAVLRLDGTRQGIERWGVPRPSLLGVVASALLEEPTDWYQDKELPERGADELTKRLLDWITTPSRAAPWFAYAHYMEPHSPYAAPPEWEAEFVRGTRRVQPPEFGMRGLAPFDAGAAIPERDRLLLIDEYDAEIASWDHAFGGLLADLTARGVLDDTIVLVTADHGESFFEHRLWQHHNGLYDELIHVPMVLRIPGRPAGRCDVPVSHTGVMQTLVDAAGFTLLDSRAAPPLIPLPTEPVPCRSHFTSGDLAAVCVIQDGIKWILSQRGNRSVLNAFDLTRDPGETADLAPADPTRAATMQDALLQHAALERASALNLTPLLLGDTAEDALRSLGYIR